MDPLGASALLGVLLFLICALALGVLCLFSTLAWLGGVLDENRYRKAKRAGQIRDPLDWLYLTPHD